MLNEMQAVRVRTQPDRDAHVRESGRDCSRDFQMAADFVLVSRDARGLHPQIVKRFIEYRARTRSIFAVDYSQAWPFEIREAANRQRIAGRGRQSQLPARKVQSHRTSIA